MQVQDLLSALQNPQVFQSFQTDPLKIAAQYGVILNPEFAKELRKNLLPCSSLGDVKAKGQAGFRSSPSGDSYGPNDGGGGRGGGTARGIRIPDSPSSPIVNR